MSSSRRFIAPSIGLLLAAGLTPAAAQQPQRIEVTTRRAGSDSVDRQFRTLQRQVDSLARVYDESDELTVSDRRRLEETLRATIGRLAALSEARSEFRFRVSAPGERMPMPRGMFEHAQATPKGWLGFVAVGAGMPSRVEQGEFIVRYLSYPRIVSVEPSSPAQRAGIVPDDTLIAYDGLDVRDNDISMTKLLRPNAKIMVRLRHDGRVRDVPVIVAEAPQRIVLRRDAEARSNQETWVVAAESPPFPRTAPPAVAGGGEMVRVTSSGRGASAPTAAGQGGASAGGIMPSRMGTLSRMPDGIAGAQVATIDRDGAVAKAFGVEGGAFLSTVPFGSAAHESGLVQGDIVVRAAGRQVRSATEFREIVRLVSENGERAVELEVVRERKTQRMMLKW